MIPEGSSLPPPVRQPAVKSRIASKDLAVHVGDQLIVFPDAGSQGPICVAASSPGIRCRHSVQDAGYSGWWSWEVLEMGGEVAALESLSEANFLKQRCSSHLDSDALDMIAPTWAPFSPEQHADLVAYFPKKVWTPEGLRTIRPKADDREPEPEPQEDSLAAMIAEAFAGRIEPPCQTVLYRYFDAQDRLLYVGITDNLFARTASHAESSSWMDFATRSTIDRHPTRKAAETAEREAIKAESPLFNHQHNDTPEARRRLVEYLIEHGRIDLLAADVSRG